MGARRHGRRSGFTRELANDSMRCSISKGNDFTIAANDIMFQRHGFECRRERNAHRMGPNPPSWDAAQDRRALFNGCHGSCSGPDSLHTHAVSPALVARGPYWASGAGALLGPARPRRTGTVPGVFNRTMQALPLE